MNNRNVLKGVLLILIAVVFGLGSLRYPLGHFSHAGPGLFPLLVSGLLLLVGAAIVVRALMAPTAQMEFNLRNIAIVLGSLCAFAVTSAYLNMIAGIVVLVFGASLAGRSYSVVRNAKVASGLIVIALMFQKLLGLQLPLY